MPLFSCFQIKLFSFLASPISIVLSLLISSRIFCNLLPLWLCCIESGSLSQCGSSGEGEIWVPDLDRTLSSLGSIRSLKQPRLWICQVAWGAGIGVHLQINAELHLLLGCLLPPRSRAPRKKRFVLILNCLTRLFPLPGLRWHLKNIMPRLGLNKWFQGAVMYLVNLTWVPRPAVSFP